MLTYLINLHSTMSTVFLVFPSCSFKTTPYTRSPSMNIRAFSRIVKCRIYLIDMHFYWIKCLLMEMIQKLIRRRRTYDCGDPHFKPGSTNSCYMYKSTKVSVFEFLFNLMSSHLLSKPTLAKYLGRVN